MVACDSTHVTGDGPQQLHGMTRTGTEHSEYVSLFESLDIKRKGEITFLDFTTAVKKFNHPVGDNAELLQKVFDSFDEKKDKVIDLEEFKSHLATTDSQIEEGFHTIDQDRDGKVTRDDFRFYLQEKFGMNPSEALVDHVFRQFDAEGKGYIRFDEFRWFLRLMPRLHGLRVRTVFFYTAEEFDLLWDGDVTLRQFLSGFGFFLAGGLAGVVSRTCTAPFDRIKVFLIARTDLLSTIMRLRQQIAQEVALGALRHVIEEARRKLREELAQAKKEVPHERTIRLPLIQAARTIWKQGGMRAFYVGNGLNVVKVFPESAIKFGTFEAAKRFFARVEGVNDTTQLLKWLTYLAGGLGGVVLQFLVYPIDTLKFRLQCLNLDSHVKGNALLVRTAQHMLREGGVRLFYKGVFVGLLGIFPYAALDLGTFSTIKTWLVKRELRKLHVAEDDVRLPNWMVLTLGATSGCFGATVVYPINLLRTRLQAQGTYAHPYTYNGFVDVFSKTWLREGFPGLYKGLVPNLAKVAPAVSISYFVYENSKYLMGLDSKLE